MKKNINLSSTLKKKNAKTQKDVQKIERIVEAVHEEKTKRLTLEVRQSLHTKIKSLAAEQGISIKEYMTNLIEDSISL